MEPVDRACVLSIDGRRCRLPRSMHDLWPFGSRLPRGYSAFGLLPDRKHPARAVERA